MNSQPWIAMMVAVCLHATASVASAGSFLPSGTFLEGGGSVQLHGSVGGTGTTYCTFGNSDGNTCSASFIGNAGSSNGTAAAYVDQNGAHVYAVASSVGGDAANATATAIFSDSATNILAFSPMEFMAQFTLHAQLDTVNVSLAQYTVAFNMSGACNGTQTWTNEILGGGTNNPGANVNVTLNAPNCQINPGATLNWSLRLTGLALTAIQGTETCASNCGAPYAVMDASNTLSVDGFSITSPLGEKINGLFLQSSHGYDYSIVADPTPEPGTFLLVSAGMALLGLWRRILSRVTFSLQSLSK